MSGLAPQNPLFARFGAAVSTHSPSPATAQPQAAARVILKDARLGKKADSVSEKRAEQENGKRVTEFLLDVRVLLAFVMDIASFMLFGW